MHVDGFRFDLAATLGRGDRDFDPHGAFLAAVGQDPVLSQVKLIAEPWDTGAGGYEVGDFPPGWSEWNGRYRDTVRDFWRGAEGTLADFATRITGSQDLYGRGRRPTASINLVTVHDGFTLADLTAYDRKHNEANGEGSRDGTDDNRSWNCGAEGPTGDPHVNALRARQRRNLLATLLLSEGVPLLLAGDEFGRSQGGNNNAYCQDNAISWVDWSAQDAELLTFVRRLCRLRHEHPDFRRRRFLTGADATWLRPDGQPMNDADWAAPYARAAAVLLRGEETFLAAANSWWEPLEFALPSGTGWAVAVDTAEPASTATYAPGATLPVGARSLVLLAPAD
jgi:glycogen operon protein